MKRKHLRFGKAAFNQHIGFWFLSQWAQSTRTACYNRQAQ